MISPEGLSVPALLDAAAEQDREAAVFPDGRACVTELSALSSSYARALVSLGIGPGDHVGALLPAGLSVVWPMSGTKIQKARLRQRIADELAAASVLEAPRLSRPAAQAESA